MTTIFDSIEVSTLTRGAGMPARVAVRAATTGSVGLHTNLNGASVDGVTLTVGDRLLVRAQSTQAQQFTVTTQSDVAGNTQSEYFIFSTPSTDYYVWNNVGGAGVDPAVAGRVGIMAAYALNAAATAIASAIASAINVVLVGAASPVGNVVTVTLEAAWATAAEPGSSDWTVNIVAPGSGPIDQGIWIVQAGAGASYRAGDMLVGDSANALYVQVEEGSTFGLCSFLQTAKPSTVGVHGLTWVMQDNSSYTANSIQYATSSNTIGSISSVANAVVTTTAGGVPQMTTSLPAGITINGPFVSDTQIVNKEYVDSIASGLDPKESVRVRTLANIGGTYVPTGGVGGTGSFTGVDLTSLVNFDLGAATLVVGNRVLIMNQTDPKQNGIYRVTTAGVAGALERSLDQNGTPAAEVSGGNYTFVEVGSTYAATGWVLQGDGVLTLNTDNLIWTQFSAAQSFNALDGIQISGSNIGTRLFTNGGIVYNGASPNGALQVDLSASAITGTLSGARGGTGQSTYATGDLLIGASPNSLTKLTAVAQRVLTTDASGVVSWRNDAHLTNILGASALEPQLIAFSNTNSAVNHIGVANSVTTAAPIISASGGDTDINLRISPKGTGAVEITGSNGGELRFWNPATSFYAGLKSGSMLANQTWTLPLVDGANGDVIRTNGTGVLSFASPTATQRDVLPWVYNQLAASGATLTTVAYFTWTQAEYATIGSAKVMYNCDITGGKVLEVQVWNATTATQLALDTRSVSGFYSFAFTLPTANAQLQLRIRKTVGGGANPTLSGVNLVFNPVS